ncbi:MAG: hypothetical protein ACRDZ1_04680 [Acidimicrobiia bacterium]
MPKSRVRAKTRMRKTERDRQIKAEARAAAQARRGRWGRLRRMLGWPVCAFGAALFAGTLVANFGGFVLLPFDPHHIFGQGGGLVLAVTGLVWATS